MLSGDASSSRRACRRGCAAALQARSRGLACSSRSASAERAGRADRLGGWRRSRRRLPGSPRKRYCASLGFAPGASIAAAPGEQVVQNPVKAVIALLLCTWLGVASAADVVVGSIVAVRGDVFADTGSGAPQPLMVNAPVRLGDTIVTGRGKAKVALSDGSIVSIGENTRVQVSHFTSPDTNPVIRLNLFTGVLRPLVSRTTTGSFEVETQTAIAAVRGTEWLMEATAENTAVALLRGRVAVSKRDD